MPDTKPPRAIRFRAWDEHTKEMYQDVTYEKESEGGVRPWVFMQFTGLLDKNGTEIYEGDIIEGPHDFGPGGFHVRRGEVHWHKTQGYQWNYWKIEEIEVIGNIHQHPDLLTPNPGGERDT